MSWDMISKCVIEAMLFTLGGLTVLAFITIGVVKLLGKKWVDLLFEKCIIRYRYKQDKELAFKTAQYNSLIPEQKVIVKELYSKILRLQQSTKLFAEWFDVLKEEFIKEPITEIEEIDELEIKIIVVPHKKGSKEKFGRIFTMEEIEKVGNYHSIKKEVEEYIQQNTIYIPKDIYDYIKVALFLIELFMYMHCPKELIHYWTQNSFDREERNKVVNEIEEFKQSVGFENVKEIEVIDSFLDFIENQFRSLLGVENSNR